MFQVFGILLAAVLLFRLKGRSAPPITATPPKTISQVEVIPRPMTIIAPSAGASLIEGMGQAQAPIVPVAMEQYNPQNTGFETPPIVAWDNPYLTF